MANCTIFCIFSHLCSCCLAFTRFIAPVRWFCLSSSICWILIPSTLIIASSLVARHETAIVICNSKVRVIQGASRSRARCTTDRIASTCNSSGGFWSTSIVSSVIIRLSAGSVLCNSRIIGRGGDVTPTIMLIARMCSCACLRHIEAIFIRSPLVCSVTSCICPSSCNSTIIWRCLLFEMIVGTSTAIMNIVIAGAIRRGPQLT